MTAIACGTFDVSVLPAPSELDGAVDRFDLDKVFHGDLEGVSSGIMLSSGDPAAGAAGYVAVEAVRGVLDGRRGGFVFVQLGLMRDGARTLHYEIVPGSGDGELEGITGRLELVIDADGTHRFELSYEL